MTGYTEVVGGGRNRHRSITGQLDEVKSLLASIDGKKTVASMAPDALVELVM